MDVFKRSKTRLSLKGTFDVRIIHMGCQPEILNGMFRASNTEAKGLHQGEGEVSSSSFINYKTRHNVSCPLEVMTDVVRLQI